MKNIYDEMLQLSRGKKSGVLVTVVEKTGSGPADAGSKMIVYSDGTVIGTVGGGTIEKMAVEKATGLIESRGNALETFTMDDPGDGTRTGMLCGGTATLFFECFAPQNHIEQPLIDRYSGVIFLPSLVPSRFGVVDSEENIVDSLQWFTGISGEHPLVVDKPGDVCRGR